VPWGGSDAGFVEGWKPEWYLGGIQKEKAFRVLEILGFVGMFQQYVGVLPCGGAVMNGFK